MYEYEMNDEEYAKALEKWNDDKKYCMFFKICSLGCDMDCTHYVDVRRCNHAGK